MEERVKALPLSEEDLNRYMKSVIGNGSGQGTENLDILFSEPEATLQWVAAVRDESDQRRMIPEMLVNWANRDADAAVNWLGRQAPSPVRDASINQLVTKSPNLAGESAAAWAIQIQHEQTRANALQTVVGRWKDEDPAATAAWLKQQGLSQSLPDQ